MPLVVEAQASAAWRALDDAASIVDPGQDVIVATGTDRVRFLHGILTADIAGTLPGHGVRAALLSLKGHVVVPLLVFVREGDVRILAPRGQGAAAAAALSRYAVMDDFTAAVDAGQSVLGVVGPAAAERLAAAGASTTGVGAEPWSHDLSGALWMCRVRHLGRSGFWIAGPLDAVNTLQTALATAGVPVLDDVSTDAARVAAGEPAWGAEITTDRFPMEVGLDDAIDYGKGCYLGQEPVVRIRDRGHLNRRLARLAWTGPGEVTAGDAIESDTRPAAGTVTSAARLPDGRGVALALVHSSVPAGGTVRVRHGDSLVPAVVS